MCVKDTATTEIYTLSLHDARPIYLLERVRGSVRLERPHLHLSEALAAELRLAAQRLLGDERVRAGAARVDLVVHEVQQDRKSTRLNSSHANISSAVFCLNKQPIAT